MLLPLVKSLSKLQLETGALLSFLHWTKHSAACVPCQVGLTKTLQRAGFVLFLKLYSIGRECFISSESKSIFSPQLWFPVCCGMFPLFLAVLTSTICQKFPWYSLSSSYQNSSFSEHLQDVAYGRIFHSLPSFQ